MILLIPEINLLNYPLFLLASLKHQVMAYRMHPTLARFKGRIKILDMADYFIWERCVMIKSEAANICEDIFSRFPSAGWEIEMRGRPIDLSLKAKQELKKDIEELLFLNHIIDFYKQKSEDARIISSLRLNFLSRLYGSYNIFHSPTVKMISSINIFLDRLNLLIWNLAMAMAVSYQFIIGLINNKELKGNIRYICDGITPREISIDKDRITFSWIADEKILSKENILFILPKADFQTKIYDKDYRKDRELAAITRYQLSKIASRKEILLSLPVLLNILVNGVLFSPWSIERLMTTGYAIRVVRWMPMLDTLKPAVYISSLSSNGVEDPAIVYFKEIGMKTVAWAYGTNAFSFCTNIQDCMYKDILFYNMLFSDVMVWNRHIKGFIEEHAQSGAKIHVIGPLMGGDESIMRINKVALFKKFGASYDPSYKYIAIFDAPPVSIKYSGYSARFPHPNTNKYNYEFIRDMKRLSSDFKNVILVYKPKRSLTSGKFSYAEETRKLIDEMSQNRKVIILDYNMNPWAAIAAADMCISMIFESPTTAAIHYGKAAVFHDPSNIVLYHRYKDFPELITHFYDELKSMVERFLCGDVGIKDILDEEKLGRLQGIFPGENSSDKFREYLRSL